MTSEQQQQKAQRVTRWLENNSAQGARAMVKKFDLAWSHEKDLGNGLSLVGLYTDESMAYKITEIHDSADKWFR